MIRMENKALERDGELYPIYCVFLSVQIFHLQGCVTDKLKPQGLIFSLKIVLKSYS